MQAMSTVSNAELMPQESFIAFPYDISFIDCAPSPAVRFQVEECLAKVAQIHDRIMDCKVAVRIPHKRSHNRFFHIHIQMDVPGRRLAVSREPEMNEKHIEMQTAIRKAFHKLTRQLEDYLNTRHSY